LVPTAAEQNVLTGWAAQRCAAGKEPGEGTLGMSTLHHFVLTAPSRLGTRLLLALFLFLAGGLAPAPAAAQTGGISGFVRDTTGNPVGGALVEVTTPSTVDRQATSAGDGSYALTGLNPGQYTFTVSKAGFRSATRGFSVVSGDIGRVDFTIQPETSTTGTVEGLVTQQGTR
jgi:hypothetical protein